jgi:hypothetical protein
MRKSVEAMKKLLALSPCRLDKVTQLTFADALAELTNEGDPLAQAAARLLRKYQAALSGPVEENPNILPGFSYDLRLWIKRLEARPDRPRSSSPLEQGAAPDEEESTTA